MAGMGARPLPALDYATRLLTQTSNCCGNCPRRVGRTGRAGAKGTAITFIGPDEEQYAPDLVKALKESGAAVPQDLQVGPLVGGWAHVACGDRPWPAA